MRSTSYRWWWASWALLRDVRGTLQAAGRVVHNNVGLERFLDGFGPCARGPVEGPERTSQGDLVVVARTRQRIRGVSGNVCLAGEASANEPLGPSAQIVGDMTDIGRRRPHEVVVLFSARSLGESGAELRGDVTYQRYGLRWRQSPVEGAGSTGLTVEVGTPFLHRPGCYPQP